MISLLYYLINKAMDMKIVRATSKGQVTLPKAWRDQFKTNNFMIIVKKEKLIVKPVDLEETAGEIVLFDSVRDNGGEGVPSSEMLRILKKLQNESN